MLRNLAVRTAPGSLVHIHLRMPSMPPYAPASWGMTCLYPQTPDGQVIDWTKLTIETATCLLELRRRVRARVAYVYAHHDEDVAARRWRDVRGGQ